VSSPKNINDFKNRFFPSQDIYTILFLTIADPVHFVARLMYKLLYDSNFVQCFI